MNESTTYLEHAHALETANPRPWPALVMNSSGRPRQATGAAAGLGAGCSVSVF
jgi:hypothetical protein